MILEFAGSIVDVKASFRGQQYPLLTRWGILFQYWTYELSKNRRLYAMKVLTSRFLKIIFGDSDVVIIIECQCGNKTMLNESDGFFEEEVYVCLFGVRQKNLRCHGARSICRERYRIILRMEADPPFIEVAHIAPRPSEETLEIIQVSIA